jgi:hypothetical protein
VAQSEKGTEVKIPINYESVSDNSLFIFDRRSIIFKWELEDTGDKGLELEFDLDITDDAEVEVILDRDSGHGIERFWIPLFKINTLGKFNMWAISGLRGPT